MKPKLFLAILGTVIAALAATAQVLAVTGPAHATIGPFHFQTNDFKIDSKHASEVVMPQFSISPGSSNGWHVHPGPGFIVVTSGTLTLYQETRDGGCTRSTYGPNQGFVEAPGRVHVARNEGGTALTGVATFLDVPAGTTAFRSSVPAPANCPGIH